jgi:2-polyprenyl-3-methyl-5-hydroxy-6-metoxy-1,4-benzoquinol methylase
MKTDFYKKIRNKLVVNTREFIFNLNKKIPLIGRPLVAGWCLFCDLKFIIKKEILKLSARFKYGNDKLNFEKTCWVDPQKINYCLVSSENKFNIWKNYCKILDGDWDKSTIKFEELDIYQALKQRFNENKEWEETKFYQRVLEQISSGTKKWECKNKEEFDARLKKLDLLYQEIKDNGYKLQTELYTSGSGGALDEIAVVIDRNGQLLLVEGRHRLSVAKLLNLSKIPIKIIARHKKWMDFRKELIFFSKNYQKGRLYQPLTHPDLQDIPFQRDGEERFEIIKGNLTIKSGTFLDIGANLGYFCHKFEEQGFDCYALEENRMCLYFLEKLKRIENKKFKIISENLFEYKKKQKIVFDVVLALSIFHHFLDRKDTYLSLVDFIKRLEVKELIFEPYLPAEFQGRKTYQSYTPEQFVNFIIENSNCLKQVELIGKSDKGRPIYKIIP